MLYNGNGGGAYDTDPLAGIGKTENGTEPVGQSLQLAGNGVAYGDFVWAGPAAATAGAPNAGQTFGEGGDPEPAPDPCEVPVTHAIPRVQGPGFASDLVGATVTIEGVVGDFQDADQLRGIFLQDPAGVGDPATSDGIFVDDPDSPPVAAGDVVRVTGMVTESFGLTELTAVTAIADCGDAPVPAPFAFGLPADMPGDVIRLGDNVVDVVGVMSYGFGEYRLQQTRPATVLGTNPRPPAPDNVGGDVLVASFNVLNYFMTIDDGDPFPRNLPRGADTDAELVRQRAKIVEAIATLDADVVGLMEIENDEDDAAIDDLVAALNARMGPGTYATVEEPVVGGTGPLGGTFGDDAIKVAMIYKPSEVRPLGPAVTTTDPAFANARLPLARRSNR